MEQWMQTTLSIIGVISGVFSLVAVGISIGLLKGTIKQLEVTVNALQVALNNYVTKDAFSSIAERAREDRIKNEEQHKTFYALENQVVGLSQQFIGFNSRLERVESGIDELLRRTKT